MRPDEWVWRQSNEGGGVGFDAVWRGVIKPAQIVGMPVYDHNYASEHKDRDLSLRENRE